MIMRYLASIVLVFSFVSQLALPVRSQDLVAGGGLASSSSVFVFPKGTRAPHARSGGGRVDSSGLRGGLGGGAFRTSSAKPRTRPAQPQASSRPNPQATAANRNRVRLNTLLNNGEKQLESGNADAAIVDFRAAMAIDGKNKRAMDGLSDALTVRAMAEIQRKEFSKARASLNEAITLDPTNDLAFARLGSLYESEDNDTLAITNYEKALNLNPQNTYLLEPLAVASYEKGDLAKAESYLDRADAVGGGSTGTAFLRGVILFKKDQPASALAQFEKVIAADSRHSMSYYYRGLVLDKLGSAQQAVDSLKRSIELDPNNSAANFDLGVIEYNKGDFAAAASHYENAVRVDAKFYEAYANLGSTYRQLERWADAIAAFRSAEPGVKRAEMYTDWGYCLGKQKEWDTAAAKLEEAAKISPNAPERSNVGWAYINGAEEDQAAKRDDIARTKMEKAREVLRVAVEIDSKLDAALLNLGSTNNFLGDFNEAVRVLNLALAIRKDWTIALTQLGFGYRGLKDFTRAIAAFKRVADLEPRTAAALFNLGEIYFLAGNKKEAQKIRGQLAKIDPTLASQLDNVLAGRAVDAARRTVESRIPRPRIPF